MGNENKITVQEAAQEMGVTPRFLQMGLQYSKFPFGTAVKMKRWAYYINRQQFEDYMGAKKPSAGGTVC